MTDYTAIATTAINALPGILALLKANHAQQNPGAPVMTDADALRGLNDAVFSTVAKDDAWKAAHPANATSADGHAGA